LAPPPGPLVAPPARSRRTMMERPWRSELWSVAMADSAAAGDSKSTRPQPLLRPPGCFATSALTTEPTEEKCAVVVEKREKSGRQFPAPER